VIQYHLILSYQNDIFCYINEYIDKETSGISVDNKNLIKNDIYNCLHKSLKYDKGLADNLSTSKSEVNILNIISNIMYNTYSCEQPITQPVSMNLFEIILNKINSIYQQKHQKNSINNNCFDIYGTTILQRVTCMMSCLGILHLYEKHNYQILNKITDDIENKKLYLGTVVNMLIPKIKYYTNYRTNNIYITWDDYKQFTNKIEREDSKLHLNLTLLDMNTLQTQLYTPRSPTPTPTHLCLPKSPTQIQAPFCLSKSPTQAQLCLSKSHTQL
jgi:hypothetical protein